MIPDSLKYTKDHEWLKVEGKTGLVGVTHYAQDHLGDVVFLELPAIGKALKQHDEFGVVESVKSVSSLYSPVSGKVLAVNADLNNAPQLVNESPYEKAWMIKIELSNPAEVETLLSAADYNKLISS